MKIQVNVFDPDSVDMAIAEVNKYKRTINEKVKEIVTELGMRGRQIVDNQYSILEEYEIYEVDCIVNGTSAMIIAEGDNVVFLEFGTGVDVEDNSNEMETEGLPTIASGSWSATEGRGTFVRHGHWHYNGIDYTGTMATHGFYFASKEIRDKAVEVAKRIFKK